MQVCSKTVRILLFLFVFTVTLTATSYAQTTNWFDGTNNYNGSQNTGQKYYTVNDFGPPNSFCQTGGQDESNGFREGDIYTLSLAFYDKHGNNIPAQFNEYYVRDETNGQNSRVINRITWTTPPGYGEIKYVVETYTSQHISYYQPSGTECYPIYTDNGTSVDYPLGQQMPDLIVTSFTLNPSSVQTGNATTYTITVMNDGAATANDFWLGYETDGACPAGGGNCGLQTAGTSLAPTQTRTFTGSFTPSTAVGSHTVTAIADYWGQVAEKDEGNNRANTPFYVNAVPPDIIVTAFSLNPSSVQTGNATNYSITVQNVGGQTANDFWVGYNVDGSCPLGGTNCYLQSVGSTLAPGATKTFTGSFTPTTAVGNHTITAIGDYINHVAESNEGNNTANAAFTVTALPPDLTITSFTLSPGSIIQGSNTTYTITVQNIGGQTAGASQLGFNTNGACPNCFKTSIPSLTPGQTYTYTGSANPTSTVGTHTVNAIIDVDGTVAESNESNNAASAQITVVSGAAVLIGPLNSPTAVGPTSNNDDYTSASILGDIEATGALTSARQVVITHTLRNNGGVADTFRIVVNSVNSGMTVEASPTCNGSYTTISGGGSVLTPSVAVGANYNVCLRYTLPAGFATYNYATAAIGAVSQNNTSVTNQTFSYIYSGFIRVIKSATIANATGTGGASDPVPGADITYTLSYTNIHFAPVGTGNVNLPATNLVITEDGNAAPNNWGTITTHIVGSVTASRGTVSGDTTNSTVVSNSIGTLQPQETGTFSFKRKIK